MKTIFVVFLLWTSALPGIGLAADAAQADAASSAAPTSTALRIRGTIDKYDAATHVLSVKTSDGTLQLSLAPTVRIREDRHEIDAMALGGLSGYRVAVRYSESGGNKTAESIHVFGNNERKRR